MQDTENRVEYVIAEAWYAGVARLGRMKNGTVSCVLSRCFRQKRVVQCPSLTVAPFAAHIEGNRFSL